MKKTLSDKRREVAHQLLHALRKREVKEIEGQLGRESDPSLTRKIDAAMDVGDWASLDLAEGVDHKSWRCAITPTRRLPMHFGGWNPGHTVSVKIAEKKCRLTV
jgi:hypothetical protein